MREDWNMNARAAEDHSVTITGLRVFFENCLHPANINYPDNETGAAAKIGRAHV